MQIATPGPALIVGVELTVTVTVFVILQPKLLYPVTVYVVVTVGLAITAGPAVDDKPVDGDQE